MARNTFISPHHGTDAATDCEQWRKFDAFHVLGCRSPLQVNRLSLEDLDASGYIFMRWKERSFLSRTTGGSFGSLTIAGFYYVRFALLRFVSGLTLCLSGTLVVFRVYPTTNSGT